MLRIQDPGFGCPNWDVAHQHLRHWLIKNGFSLFLYHNNICVKSETIFKIMGKNQRQQIHNVHPVYRKLNILEHTCTGVVLLKMGPGMTRIKISM